MRRRRRIEPTPDFSKSKHLNGIFREIAKELGQSAENRFAEVLGWAHAEGILPPWILKWWASEHFSDEDLAGVDFTIKTTVGKIYIQIKSSVTGAKKFKSQHKGEDIVVIIINISDSNHDTFTNIMAKISESGKGISRSQAA